MLTGLFISSTLVRFPKILSDLFSSTSSPHISDDFQDIGFGPRGCLLGCLIITLIIKENYHLCLPQSVS